MVRLLLKQAVTVVFSRALLKIANFFALMVIARATTIEEFGLYGLFVSVVVLVVAVANFGVRQSGAQCIGQKKTAVVDVLSASLLILPVGVITGIGMGIVIIGWLSGYPLKDFIPFLAFAVSGALLISFSQGVFLGRGEFKRLNLSELLPGIFLLVIILLLGEINALSISTVLATYCTGVSVVAIICFFWAYPNGDTIDFRQAIESVPSLIERGWPYALALSFIIANERTGVFLLSGKMGSEASGMYFAALRVNRLFLEVAAALGLVLFSHGIRTEHERDAVVNAAGFSCWVFWLAIIISTFGFFLSPLYMAWFLGKGYELATSTMRVLIVGLPFMALNKILYPAFAALGMARMGVLVYGLALIVNLSVALILMEQGLVTGAAVSLVVANLLICIIFIGYASRRFDISPKRFFIPEYSSMASLRAAVSAVLRR